LIQHSGAGKRIRIKIGKLPLVIAGVFTCLLLLPALAAPVRPSRTEQVIADVKLKSAAFTQSCDQLRVQIGRLQQGDELSIKNARLALLNCRRHYKVIAFFLEYYFKSSADDYNAPPKFDPEEPEDDYRDPVGMQQMEALLFNANVAAQKDKLLQLAGLMSNAAHGLPSLFSGFHTSDAQLLRCLQVTLVRIMTLDITGYDAPLFKSGIIEARDEMAAIQTALAPFLDQQPSAKISSLLSAALLYLQKHPDFNSFNRMRFLTGYAMPLQQQLNLYIAQAKLEVKATGILNTHAKNIFSPDALNKDVFLDFPAKNKQLVALGKVLFFDKRLSGPATRSCATCHQPDRYFTDGLPQSKAIAGNGHVLRNAPTLLYAGFQYTQFWDARAKSLVEQVREVLNNKEEMAADDNTIIARLKYDKKYTTLFKAAFPLPVYQRVTMYGIAEGLTAYVLSLSPRNSTFDMYMAGDRSALTNSQIKGFNLFMGKGQCGACHFAPLFNGLVPPFYQTSELEIIGVPKTDNRKKVLADEDEGAYRSLPVKYYKGAFKTPTVRNTAKTGPYMHNGSFKNLNTVLDLYNAGGGNGWGLDNSEQTLSADSLKLTNSEIKAIVDFLNCLTDKPILTKTR
jgi:cytochrome c peroxidase